jgi:hypothetical protein
VRPPCLFALTLAMLHRQWRRSHPGELHFSQSWLELV